MALFLHDLFDNAKSGEFGQENSAYFVDPEGKDKEKEADVDDIEPAGEKSIMIDNNGPESGVGPEVQGNADPTDAVIENRPSKTAAGAEDDDLQSGETPQTQILYAIIEKYLK